VVVHYLNIVRVAVPPAEADAPLVVHPDAVLAGSISAYISAMGSVGARVAGSGSGRAGPKTGPPVCSFSSGPYGPGGGTVKVSGVALA